MFRELRAVGASADVAKQVAANSRRWSRNSDGLLKTTLTIAYFDGLAIQVAYFCALGHHQYEQIKDFSPHPCP